MTTSPRSTFERRAWLAAISIAWISSAACQTPVPPSTHEIGTQASGAFVWRGFDHRWTYNHRLKRMGDFLTQSACSDHGNRRVAMIACTGATHHTGAAGTGSDELAFTSYYTEAASRDVRFHSARATLSMEGPEQREIRRTETVEVPVDSDGRVAALLNGYDLRTVAGAKAKKIKRFRLRIGDKMTRRPESGTIDVDVEALIDANCGSAECLLQSNRVHYRLDVEILVLEARDVQVNTRGFETSYRWSRRDELRHEDVALNRQRQSISGVPGEYDVGLAGFRGVDFDLSSDDESSDSWFVRWNQSIEDVDYRRRSGRISFDLSLFFKEWNARTKSQVLSLASAGAAELEADVSLLQFPNGATRRRQHSGTLDWVGRTHSSNVAAGVSWADLRFQF